MNTLKGPSLKGLWLSLLFCFSLSGTLAHADQQQALLELAELLAEAISTNNYTSVNQRFDRDGFAKRTIETMQLSASDAQSMKQQLLGSMNLGTIIGNGLSGYTHEHLGVKVIGIVRDKKELLPVVRISFPEGGTNYYELRVKKIKNQYFIYDIFIRANSQYISETIGQAVVMMLGLPSGWIAALAYPEGSRNEVVKLIGEANAARAKGDFQSAFDFLQELPQSVKEEDVVNLMMVMISAQLGDDIYRRELSIFAERQSENPRYNFMLIDHYYYMGQYQKAFSAVEKMLKRYPNDAALMQIKAVIYLEQKEYQKADAVLQLAQQLEPDFEDTYWTGVAVNLRKKDYARMIYWLEQLEQQSGAQFDAANFEDDETYKEFINSDEFLHWMTHKSI